MIKQMFFIQAVDEIGNSLYATRYGFKHPYMKGDYLDDMAEAMN